MFVTEMLAPPTVDSHTVYRVMAPFLEAMEGGPQDTERVVAERSETTTCEGGPLGARKHQK